MALEQILSLLQHSSGRGSRSTALQPLTWLLAVLAVFFVGSLKYRSPVWISAVILIAVVLTVLVYLTAYLYLIKNNPDATRSEKFALEKMALQQSRTGDNQSGFSERQLQEATAVVLPNTVETVEQIGDGREL